MFLASAIIMSNSFTVASAVPENPTFLDLILPSPLIINLVGMPSTLYFSITSNLFGSFMLLVSNKTLNV